MQSQKKRMSSYYNLQDFFKDVRRAKDEADVKEQVQERIYMTRVKFDSQGEIIKAANMFLAPERALLPKQMRDTEMLEQAAIAVFRAAPPLAIEKKRDREQEEEDDDQDDDEDNGEDIAGGSDKEDAQDRVDAGNDLLLDMQAKMRRMSKSLLRMSNQISAHLE